MAAFTAIGQTGKFTIKSDGFHPQAGYAFSYNDSKYRFWFYVEIRKKAGRSGYDLEIDEYATLQRFAGGRATIEPADRSVVAANIRTCFERIDIFGGEIGAANPGPESISMKFRFDAYD